MRKVFTLFALCVCAFGFVSCNDDDEKEPVEQQETTRYRLQAWQGEELPDVPATIEGILIFGKKKSSGIEDTYFSTEANMEVSPFDGVVQSPWRELNGIGYMEILYKIKDKYFGVEYYVQKNTDNYIRLNQSNEITKQTYDECKRHYELHAR